MSGKNEFFDDAGRLLAEELSRILHHPMQKMAAAPGTPGEGASMIKRAGISKFSEMPMRSLLEHPDFVRGMQEEMNNLRPLWEPLLTDLILANLE
jgi:hypothetical protein